MDVDGVCLSLSSILKTHGTYLLRITSNLTLALLLPRLLNVSHLCRAIIFLCVTAYILFFAAKRYSSNIPSEEDTTPAPNIDTTPTLSRKGKLTMQTSPTFERVQAAGKAKPTHAVVWPKSQVWKRDALAGWRKGGGKGEWGEGMGW